MNNKIIGNSFENNLSLILSDLGYWVSLFTPKNHSNSQPADMIAVRDDVALLIDAKTLEKKNGLFPISRLEENQIFAAKKFISCGNRWYHFAILWNDTIYMIPFDTIDFSKKSIDLKEQIPFINHYLERIKEIENKNR